MNEELKSRAREALGGLELEIDELKAENQALWEALEGIVPFIPQYDEHTSKWSEQLRATNRIHVLLAKKGGSDE